MRAFRVGRASVEIAAGDITTSDLEAIGNAANAFLAGGGGVDGAIHRAAGPDLAEALSGIRARLPSGRLETGGAVLTPGFLLRARFVLHCVGPVYARDGERAPELLAHCYRAALELCRREGIRSVAFPSISTG